MKKISVVLPVYNGEQYIEKSIQISINEIHITVHQSHLGGRAQICQHRLKSFRFISVIIRCPGKIVPQRTLKADIQRAGQFLIFCILDGTSVYWVFRSKKSDG